MAKNMLSNSENISSHFVFNSHNYIYEGLSLKGFDKIVSSDVKLTKVDSIDNPYAQIVAANSNGTSDSAGEDNLKLKSTKETEYNTETGTSSKIILGESSFSWGGYFQAIGVLFLLLGLLCVVLWLMRKYGKFSFIPNPSGLPKNALCLEVQLSLGPRKCLSVVRYLDKRLLIGVTDQQITLLSESKVNSDTDDTEFREIFVAEQKQDEGK